MCKGRRTPWLGCNRTTWGWMRRVRSPCDWTPRPRTLSIPSSLSVSYTHRAERTLQSVVPCCTGETLAAGLKLECERRHGDGRRCWLTTMRLIYHVTANNGRDPLLSIHRPMSGRVLRVDNVGHWSAVSFVSLVREFIIIFTNCTVSIGIHGANRLFYVEQ